MKHLLNNLTEEEKNRIRSQHKDSIKVVTENFSRLLNAKSGEIKPLVSEQDEMDDLMINKPGSGTRLRASVELKVSNLTKGTEETVTNKFYTPDSWNELILQSQGGRTGDLFNSIKEISGYAVQSSVNSENYNEGDGLVIEFTVPVAVTDIKPWYGGSNISKIDYSMVGTSDTKVTIYAKVEYEKDNQNRFNPISVIGKTDKESPIDDGEFMSFIFGLDFRKK